MDFGAILSSLRRGCEVYRAGWRRKHSWLIMQSHVSESEPPILMHTAENGFVTWEPTQADVLAYDWFVRHPEERT